MPESSEASDVKAATNRLLAWHSGISGAMTAERTSLESKLIPVSAYILVAAVECWYRHPEMMRVIDAAMPAEAIGAAAPASGLPGNAVHLWSIANIYLTGRKVLSAVPAGRRPTRAHVDRPRLLGARRTRVPRRRRGFRVGRGLRPPTVRSRRDRRAVGGRLPVADEQERARIKRFNATVVNYLFLLYFDTRVGTADTGPIRSPTGAPCSSATSTSWARATSAGRRSRATSPTTT